jgi:hypothetical protein
MGVRENYSGTPDGLTHHLFYRRRAPLRFYTAKTHSGPYLRVVPMDFLTGQTWTAV